MESFAMELSSFFKWLLISTMQVSVLICLILAVKAVLRRRLAVRWHYWLWLLLLVRMVSPWAPESNFSVFTLISQAGKKTVVTEHVAEVSPMSETAYVMPKTTNFSQGSQSVKPAKTTLQPTQSPTGTSLVSFEIIDILSMLWLIVALGLAGFALVCNFRLWRIIKSQRPLTEGKVLDLLEDCKAQMGIQTILGVVVTDKVKSPALFGVVRPRLLLPEGMLEVLSQEELRFVFLHELGHLKRHDIYLGWLMVFLQVLHWFNPLVWFAFGRMRADRELACDSLVLSTMDADKSQAYGQTLVDLFKEFSGLQYAPGIAGILENKSQLKRRITMIARFKKGSYRWSALAVVLLAVLSLVALTNAQAAAQTENKEPTALAKEFVELLVKERFSTATENFDITMKAALPVKKLKETWKATVNQAGAFNQQLGIRTEKYMSYDIVLVTCKFEKGPLDVKVVYNDKKQVSGLFFLPSPQDVLKAYEKQVNASKKPTNTARQNKKVADVISKDSRNVDIAIDDFTIHPCPEDGLYTAAVAIHNRGSKELSEFRLNFYHGDPAKNIDVTGKPNRGSHGAGPIKPDDVWNAGSKNFALKEGVNIINVVLDIEDKVAEIDETNNQATLKIVVANGQIIEKKVTIETAKKATNAAGRKTTRGKRVELSYDDGTSDDRESISGSGHAVIFEASDQGCILKAIRIYGSRYGDPRPPKEDFHIWLCDEDYNVIKDFSFPYSRFMRGNPKWVTLRVKPVEIPSTFVICADFNPEKTKGVYVHYDNSASGNSLIGLPGQEMKVFNRGEWMIRAVVQQSGSESMPLDKPKSGNKQSLLGKWESVDYVRKAEDFKPGEKSWLGELFLKDIEFFRGGKTSNPMMPKWEKEWILHEDGQTNAKYIIKEIDGTTYLFLPWLSGDVINRGQKPSYYVLKRAGEATKADKMEAESLAVEGWSLWRQKKLIEAEAKFKQAVKKDAKNANAYQGLGWTQLNQGKKLNAKNSFEKCIKIDTKNSAALNGLGWIADGQSKKDEAIAWWEKAIAANPGATASLNGLTQVYMERKQYDKAVKYYNMWLAVEPGNAQAKSGLDKAKAGLKEK